MRFVTKGDDTRRALAGVALIFAFMGFAFIVFSTVAALMQLGRLPIAEFLSVPCVFFFALPFALVALCVYLRIRPRNYFDVDETARTVTVVRQGSVERQIALDEIGPLEASLDKRWVSSGKSRRQASFYGARSQPHPDIMLHESEDERAARTELEKYSRLWKLPCVSLTGETRQPDELDVPVYMKLRGNKDATSPAEPPPGCTIELRKIDDGWEITSSYRPMSRFVSAAALLLGPIVIMLFTGGQIDIIQRIRSGEADAPDVVFAAVFGCFMLPGLITLAGAVMKHINPPIIRITAYEFAFGKDRMPLEKIEEIDGEPPRLISDERILSIGTLFCLSEETGYLRHEITRVIVEMGLQRTINELR